MSQNVPNQYCFSSFIFVWLYVYSIWVLHIHSLTDWIFDSYLCMLSTTSLPWEVFTRWTNIGSSKFFLNMHQKNWKSSSKSALATAYLCININFNPEMEWNIIFSPLSHGNWVTFWLRCLQIQIKLLKKWPNKASSLPVLNKDHFNRLFHQSYVHSCLNNMKSLKKKGRIFKT